MSVLKFGLIIAIAIRIGCQAQNAGTFESFVLGTGTRITTRSDAGRLVDGTSSLVLTAVVAQNSQSSPSLRRGVMIDLSQAGSQRTIYMDEDESMARSFAGIMDRLSNDILLLGRSGNERVIGSCEFRDNPGAYPLAADYATGATPALRILVEGFPNLFFAGRSPSDLSAVLRRALALIDAR